MSNTKIIRSLATLKKYYEERTVQCLGDTIYVSLLIEEEIKRSTRAVIWAVLGIEKTYDGFKIAERYNSGKGHTLVKFIEEKALEGAKKWVTDIVKGNFLPKLSKTGELAVRTTFMAKYLDALKKEVVCIAEEKAHEDAKRIVESLAAEELPVEILIKNLPEVEPLKENEDSEDDEYDDDEDNYDEKSLRKIERLFDV